MSATPLTYVEAFGDDPKRETRIRIILSLLDLDGDRMVSLVDAWAERWQNPDREEGVGPLILAFYVYGGAPGHLTNGGMVTLFSLRTHPSYREERADTVALEYETVYLNIPDTLSDSVRDTFAAASVAPVDTDARWIAALEREGLR